MLFSLFPNISSSLTKRMVLAFLLIYPTAAYFSMGFHHPDEHFQILELAGWRLGIPYIWKWEFTAQIRPSLQPALVYFFYRIGEWILGEVNPISLTAVLRYLTLILHTIALLLFLEPLLKDLKPETRRKILWLSIILWFFPYAAVRYSSENLSRIFFLYSAALPLWCRQQDGSGHSSKTSSGLWFIAGIFSGLAFFARFQAAFFTVGLFLWLIMKRESWKNLSWFAAGVIAACVGNILLDSWFYRDWVLTPWNYFRINLLEGKVADFGVSPWYDYFIKVFNYSLPVFPVYTLFPLLFFFLYPRHVLTWVSLPFMIVHFLIGHKELRFLFPLISFLPFFIIMVWERWRGKTARKILVNYFLIINGLLLLVGIFRPADFNMKYLYQYLYNHERGRPVYYFSDPNNPYYTPYRVNGWLAWYGKNTPYRLDVANTDLVWNDPDQEKRKYPVVLITPTPLVIGDKLNPEWAGSRPFPLPRWVYSFPFQEIEKYPRFRDFWLKTMLLPIYHIYEWEGYP